MADKKERISGPEGYKGIRSSRQGDVSWAAWPRGAEELPHSSHLDSSL